MINKDNHRSGMTVTGKFFAIMGLAAVLGVGTFVLLWSCKENVYMVLYEHGLINHDRSEMIDQFTERAKEIDLENKQEYNVFNDYVTEEARQLIDIRDYYSYIIIYDEKEEQFIKAFYPEVMDEWYYKSLTVYKQTKLDEMTTIRKVVSFKDQDVVIYFVSFYIYALLPYYLGGSVIISIFFFLIPLFFFLKQKMKEIKRLKEDIVCISQGNLTKEIKAESRDEIGILAEQLDYMRLTLGDYIRGEREGRKANKDLISAVSHDLRTPLTVLAGYLEILRLNRGAEEKREEYLSNCISKVEEIRELSDKMFEYALVYGQEETVQMTEVAVDIFQEYLRENVHFLRLVGFKVDEQIQESAGFFQGNESALKRVINNLFSNILKYGDKKRPVTVACFVEAGRLKVILTNYIKDEKENVDSNQIGLKSVKKIIEMHQGQFFCQEYEQFFSVEINI